MKKLNQEKTIFWIIDEIYYLIELLQKNNKIYENEKFQIGKNI
jgi:hypothetical protein